MLYSIETANAIDPFLPKIMTSQVSNEGPEIIMFGTLGTMDQCYSQDIGVSIFMTQNITCLWLLDFDTTDKSTCFVLLDRPLLPVNVSLKRLLSGIVDQFRVHSRFP